MALDVGGIQKIIKELEQRGALEVKVAEQELQQAIHNAVTIAEGGQPASPGQSESSS